MGKPLLKKKAKGKPLKRKPKVEEQRSWPQSIGAKPKLPPWPKVIGDSKRTKEVTTRKDVLIVSKRPDHPGYPKLDDNRVPPNTFYVVGKKDRAVQALMTFMPGGTRVAWDDCGECHQSIRYCRCRGGVFVSRAIEYIYDQSVAKEAKEEWSHNHPNYKGSYRQKQRAAYSTGRPRWVSPVPEPRVSGGAGSTKTPTSAERPAKRLRKASAPEPAPRKKLRKTNGAPKRDTAGEVFSGSTVNRSKLDAVTKTSGKSSTDELKKALGGKKLLKKKGK